MLVESWWSRWYRLIQSTLYGVLLSSHGSWDSRTPLPCHTSAEARGVDVQHARGANTSLASLRLQCLLPEDTSTRDGVRR